MTKDYSELDRLSYEIGLTLYTKEEWDKAIAQAEEKGFSFEHNSMVEEALAATFEKHPEVFDGINYINSDEGMPLWVREGVEWEPEMYDEDEDEEEED
jgi:hypothetical protein